MNMVLTLWAPEAAKVRTMTAAVLLAEDCNLLSLAAVADPLQAAGGRLLRISADGQEVTTSAGVRLSVEGDLRLLGSVDLIVVLGRMPLTPTLRAALRFAAANRGTIWAVGGAVVTLAEAGLLAGRRFSIGAPFRQMLPDLAAEGTAFTIDGSLVTCPDGPVVADVVQHLLKARLGAGALRSIRRRCMLPAPREAHDLPALPSKAPAALQATSKLIAADLAAPDPLGQAEALTGLSRRQLERLFRAHLRTSPARHLRALRLAKGRRLLRDTLWTVDRIARFVGFANQAHFCRLYRHRYGQSPHQVEAA